jgi:hypothetical protein
MLAICDVREYRECVKEFQSPLVLSLFDTLHALTNLLVVVPDNLKQVFTRCLLSMIFVGSRRGDRGMSEGVEWQLGHP